SAANVRQSIDLLQWQQLFLIAHNFQKHSLQLTSVIQHRWAALSVKAPELTEHVRSEGQSFSPFQLALFDAQTWQLAATALGCECTSDGAVLSCALLVVRATDSLCRACTRAPQFAVEAGRLPGQPLR